MSRKTNIFFNIITVVMSLGACVPVYFTFKNNISLNGLNIAIFCVLGVLIGIIVTAFVHEIGHLVLGLCNGFKFVSVSFLCFKISKVKKGIKFSFNFGDGDVGSTEMVPKNTVNLKKKFVLYTLGGSIACFVLTVLLILPFVFASSITDWLLLILLPFFPVSVAFFLDNIFPVFRGGFRSDGGVILGVKNNDDYSKTLLSILSIHSKMFQGVRPKDLDEKLLFDIPQLPEDSYLFFLILNLRYLHYADKKDNVNTAKVLSRLNDVSCYMTETLKKQIQIYTLLDYCTLNFDREKSTELLEQISTFIFKSKSVECQMAYCAYLLSVKGDKDAGMSIYTKCKNNCENTLILGLKEFQLDFLEEIIK